MRFFGEHGVSPKKVVQTTGFPLKLRTTSEMSVVEVHGSDHCFA